MCGLAGVFDLEGRRTPDPALLQRMAAALLHRGPDEEDSSSRLAWVWRIGG